MFASPTHWDAVMLKKTTPEQLFARIFATFMDKNVAQPERDIAEHKMDEWLKSRDRLERISPRFWSKPRLMMPPLNHHHHHCAHAPKQVDGAHMTPKELKKRNARICAYFASMGSSAPNEVAKAHAELVKLLEKHGLSWNDGLEIVAAAAAANKPPPSPPPPTEPSSFNVLDLVEELFKRHAFLSDNDRLIVSLWCLATWVFDKFDHTPRVLFISPNSGVGQERTAQDF